MSAVKTPDQRNHEAVEQQFKDDLQKSSTAVLSKWADTIKAGIRKRQTEIRTREIENSDARRRVRRIEKEIHLRKDSKLK